MKAKRVRRPSEGAFQSNRDFGVVIVLRHK
jgi:hypothetical protein